MIEADRLTRRYGKKLAVADLSFTVQPGVVTALLGPNGAGKSTTMRMLVGLDRPTSGTARINGRDFRTERAALHSLGALLDPGAAHPGRRARSHLRGLALSNGLGRSRVEQVLETTGLTDVAHRRVGTFSLGMKQRLALAGALLGDPQTLILDEPVNGLDPDGVHWTRTLMQSMAAEGRTVLMSSHLLNEVAVTAERVIVIGRGKLLAEGPVDDIVATATQASVLVRSPRLAQLAAAIAQQGGKARPTSEDEAVVTGLSADAIGDVAGREGIVLHQLASQQGSLEDAFLALTENDREYTGTQNVEGESA